MKGSTFRRCACRNPETGKQYGQACPKFRQKRHGLWALRQELPPREDGTRRTFRRGGYTSATDAQDDLDKVRALLGLPEPDDDEGRRRVAELLEQVAKDRAPLPDLDETRHKLNHGQSLTSRTTVGEWLDTWYASKKTRKNTNNGYASHIRVHLKPQLGHIRLDRLNVGHVQEMFDAIEAENEVIEAENASRREQEARCRPGKPGAPKASERAALEAERAKLAEMKPYRRTNGPATRQAIRRTLRTALNGAIKRQLITFNPAAHVELEPGKRPKPLLWTEERVRRWRETGEKPCSVMVWGPQMFGQFLDQAEADGERLYALFHVMGFRGLRRGEAVGQDWADVNLDAGELTVSTEIVMDGWTPYESAPKTDSSAATIGLDTATVAALRAHRARQNRERLKWGEAWRPTGKVFTREDGSWLHPESVSEAFRRICARTDLPPINLRDLRHVAATLIHAAGGDLHTIKETLRHSTITLTSDTYTSLLPEVDREVSEKAAQLVPRGRREAVGETSGLTSGSPWPDTTKAPRLKKISQSAPPLVNKGFPADPFGRPCGTRTHNQWIKSLDEFMPDSDA